ncbi:MAG: ATP-binding protein [Bacteroidia bacterium]|nr:ATP-binding protein [Bacteroidia bacterium]
MNKISALIAKGESKTLEFKSNFNTETIETLVAFANAKGGQVVIGINNKNEIIGVNINPESVQNWINEVKNKTQPSLYADAEIFTDNNKKIVVLSVSEYPIKPVSTKGKYFLRISNSNHLLTISELVDMHLRTFNTSWDFHTGPHLKLEDISLDKVQTIIDERNRLGGKIQDDPLTFLIKNELLRDGAVTHAAYLLFAKNNTLITTIEMGRFQTDIVIKDSTRTQADILTQINDVIDFVKKHINKEIIITGDPQNTQRWQYPIEAIREIVINMIVHRDYRSASDSIIKIYNNRIEFYNPGCLPENISINDLLENRYRSTPRNKLIAEQFKSLGLIEKYGSGIRRIIESFKAENLPAPKFEHISDGFMVTVFTDDVTSKVTDKVTDNQLTIMAAIRENDTITTAELAIKVNISQRKIKENIAKLKAIGFLERVGSPKSGHWKVIENHKNN